MKIPKIAKTTKVHYVDISDAKIVVENKSGIELLNSLIGDNFFKTKTGNIGIVYHSKDPDGWMSCILMTKIVGYFRNINTTNLIAIPYDYEGIDYELKNFKECSILIFVDVTPSKEFIDFTSAKIIIYDHHQSRIHDIVEYTRNNIVIQSRHATSNDRTIDIYTSGTDSHSACKVILCDLENSIRRKLFNETIINDLTLIHREYIFCVNIISDYDTNSFINHDEINAPYLSFAPHIVNEVFNGVNSKMLKENVIILNNLLFLACKTKKFHRFKQLICELDKNIVRLIEYGLMINEANTVDLIKRIKENCVNYELEYGQGKSKYCNVAYIFDNSIQLGYDTIKLIEETLNKQFDLIITVKVKYASEEVGLSFRSKDNFPYCNILAKAYKGDGHPNASGAKYLENNFDTKFFIYKMNKEIVVMMQNQLFLESKEETKDETKEENES